MRAQTLASESELGASTAWDEAAPLGAPPPCNPGGRSASSSRATCANLQFRACSHVPMAHCLHGPLAQCLHRLASIPCTASKTTRRPSSQLSTALQSTSASACVKRALKHAEHQSTSGFCTTHGSFPFPLSPRHFSPPLPHSILPSTLNS